VSETSAYFSNRLARATSGILWGGLTAGACDITYACIANQLRFGSPFSRTLQSVASGLLGRAALQGGWGTAALGLSLHFFIALAAATVYYTVSQKLTFMVRQAWLSGLTYGLLVYVFMSFVVVPLSAAPFRIRFDILGLLVHMFLVGLPIALAARKYSIDVHQHQ
jgi:hypothetical protein